MNQFIKFLLNNFPRSLLIRLSILFNPLFNFILKGTKFTDPINGKSYNKFFPYGYNNQRKNALSLGTLSLERHRLLWLYLKNETKFFNTKNHILHIAPEQCYYNIFKKHFNNYYTADLNSPLAEYKVDICKMPFRDGKFDFILCNHVLEHIPDDLKAMQELFRVMKTGGMGIFQIPLDMNRKTTFEDNSITEPKKRTKIFGQYDHVRVYGLDYFKRLESCGFKVEKVDFTKTLSKQEISKYCLSEGEIIPVVYKPN